MLWPNLINGHSQVSIDTGINVPPDVLYTHTLKMKVTP